MGFWRGCRVAPHPLSYIRDISKNPLATFHFHAQLLGVWYERRFGGLNVSVVGAADLEAAWLGEMTWTTNKYSPQEINAAGRSLVQLYNAEGTYEDWNAQQWVAWNKAAPVISNWRACHGYPLSILQMNLRRAARRFDEAPVIAQRTKRLNSIVVKLDREPQMKLSQMQDIGGCRAVVRSIIRTTADGYSEYREARPYSGIRGLPNKSPVRVLRCCSCSPALIGSANCVVLRIFPTYWRSIGRSKVAEHTNSHR
jgi:hypothetical protein